MKVHKIKVGCLMTDNGDGGYSIRVYPSYEAAEEARRERFIESNEREPTEDDWDDEYENGYLDTNTLEIRVNDDGSVELAKEVYFHAGQ